MSHWPEISRRFVLYRNSLVFDFEGIIPLKIVIKFFCGIFSLGRIFHLLTLDLTFVKNWKKNTFVFWRFFQLFQLTFFSRFYFSLFNEAGFREEFENVLTPIAILSADIFATSRSVIKREAATPVLSASSVILSYMITTVSETNIKKFLNPLSALCTGSQSLDSKEKNSAVEALKEAKVFPPGNLVNNVVFKPSFDEYFGEKKIAHCFPKKSGW